MKPLFITMEGIDGCGKSTQAALLARWMKRQGFDVLRTKEPGGTTVGKRLRNIILRGERLSPMAELFLYLADRAEHVNSVILPALKQGETVISERFSHSSLAYQGYGRGLDLGLISRLDAVATGGLRPGITLLLHISAEKAMARLAPARRDRMEAETLAFRSRVVAGYQALARQDPGIHLLPAEGTELDVFSRIRQTIEGVLERKRGKR